MKRVLCCLVAVVAGSSVPTTGSPHEGRGTASIDFDALRATAGDRGAGKMTLWFDHQPDARSVAVALSGYRPDRASRPLTGKLAQ